ncbi:hypothetical protein SNEBB_003221 [Seison nebaliae]|nr:hypothetical protein SNEBB_003221 [Seison nebaliae]
MSKEEWNNIESYSSLYRRYYYSNLRDLIHLTCPIDTVLTVWQSELLPIYISLKTNENNNGKHSETSSTMPTTSSSSADFKEILLLNEQIVDNIRNFFAVRKECKNITFFTSSVNLSSLQQIVNICKSIFNHDISSVNPKTTINVLFFDTISHDAQIILKNESRLDSSKFCHQLGMDILNLDTDIFSIENSKLFEKCFIENDAIAMYGIGRSLFRFLKAFGDSHTNIYSVGVISSKILNIVRSSPTASKSLQTNLLDLNKLTTFSNEKDGDRLLKESRDEASLGEERLSFDSVLIIDRTCDMFAPMMLPNTYYSLIHEFKEIKNMNIQLEDGKGKSQRFCLERPLMSSDNESTTGNNNNGEHDDEEKNVWKKIADVDIISANVYLQKKLKSLVKIAENMKQVLQMNQMKMIRNAVQTDLKHYLSSKTLLEKHIRLLRQIALQTATMTFDEFRYFQTECLHSFYVENRLNHLNSDSSDSKKSLKNRFLKMIKSNETDIFASFLSCIEEKVISQEPYEFLIRSLIFISILLNGLPDLHYERIVTLFTQVYGIDQLTIFQKLEELNLFQRTIIPSKPLSTVDNRHDTEMSTRDLYRKCELFQSKWNELPSYPRMLHSTYNGIRPLISWITEEFIKASSWNELKTNTFSLIGKNKCDELIKVNNEDFNESVQNVLVVLVGGITWAEISAIRQLRTDKNIVICTTHITNGSDIISTLK